MTEVKLGEAAPARSGPGVDETRSPSVRPLAWNGQAYAGALFGGTAWLLVAAGILSARGEPMSALVCTSGCLAAWGVAWWIWRTRHRRSAHRGIQLLIGSLGAVAALVVFTMDQAGALSSLAYVSIHARGEAYATLLVFPALSLMFFLRERASRGRGGVH